MCCCSWNSALKFKATIIITVIIAAVNSVSSQDLNLTNIKRQAGLLQNGKAKHIIFGGTVDGLETALIPDWDDKDDFDNWVPSIETQRVLPSYISGFDNNSRPIWVLEVGRFDLKKIFQDNEKDRLETVKYFRYLAWLGLKSHSLRSTKEHPVTDHVKIVDMEGFKPEIITNRNVYNFLRKYALRYRKYFEKNVSRMIVINVNFIGEFIINLFSQGQAKRYPGVVEVYGTSKYEWGPKIARSFPVNQLPEWYGGNRGFKPFYVIG